MKKKVIYSIVLCVIMLLLLNYSMRYNKKYIIQNVEIEKFSILKFDSLTNCMELVKWSTSHDINSTVIGLRFTYKFCDPTFFNLHKLGDHKQEGEQGSEDSIISLKILTDNGKDITSSLSYNPDLTYFSSKDSMLIKLPHTSGGWDHCYKAKSEKNIEEIIKAYNNAGHYESTFSDYSLFQLNSKNITLDEIQGLKTVLLTKHRN